jgi:hypothetical protein
MVSEGDFLRRAELRTERHRSVWFDAIFGPAQSATEFVHSHGRKVEEVMTRNSAFVRSLPLFAWHTPLIRILALPLDADQRPKSGHAAGESSLLGGGHHYRLELCTAGRKRYRNFVPAT